MDLAIDRGKLVSSLRTKGILAAAGFRTKVKWIRFGTCTGPVESVRYVYLYVGV